MRLNKNLIRVKKKKKQNNFPHKKNLHCKVKICSNYNVKFLTTKYLKILIFSGVFIPLKNPLSSKKFETLNFFIRKTIYATVIYIKKRISGTQVENNFNFFFNNLLYTIQ